MKKDEFITRIQAIGTETDAVKQRELLAQLQEDATKDYDERDTLQTTNAQLTTDNENIRNANMKLFLRLGEQNNGKSGTGKAQPDGTPEPQPKKKFEDLFDEKGELK